MPLRCRWLIADEFHPGADTPLGSSIVQRLQRFGTYGRLKRAALRAIARFVPPVRGLCFVLVVMQ